MQFLNDYLNNIRRQSLFRQITSLNPIDAVHVKDGKNILLNLASNNYLGLTHHPAVRQAAIEAISALGTGSGGARLITGNHPYYRDLEKKLAAFKHTEAAVTFSTGYMANVGIISALACPGDVIFSDEYNHASIIDGCRLSKAQIAVYRHADSGHLSELLNATPCRGKRLIITDGVFSMDGDIAPLPDIVKLAEQYQALVIVDDAHATGVIGPGGRGTAAYFGLDDKVHVHIGTLSKALGAEGGFAASSKLMIDYLINRARSFIFTTALAPATVAAANAALTELLANPELIQTLRNNVAFVRQQLTAAGFPLPQGITPIIPVIVGQAETALRLASELKKLGLIISAVRPPTVPPNASRLRLTVSAAHSQNELAAACETIITAARRMGILTR